MNHMNTKFEGHSGPFHRLILKIVLHFMKVIILDFLLLCLMLNNVYNVTVVYGQLIIYAAHLLPKPRPAII